MNRTMPLVAMALLLSACASTPSDWQWTQPERVVSRDADTIQIEWRPWQLSEEVVRGHAILYCNGRPMEEVAAGQGNAGFVRSKTWRCLGV